MSDSHPEGTTPPAPGSATPQPAYGQPAAPYGAQPPATPYGAAPAYPAYGVPAKTNTLAIVSLVASILGVVFILPFIGSIGGAITGHIGLSQIKRTGEQGRGLALAGVIIGWVGLALAIITTIILIAFWSWFITTGVTYTG